MKSIFTRQNFVVLPLALITAISLSYFVVSPAVADYQLDKETKQSCKELKKASADAELDIRGIDPESGLVYINQPVDGKDNVKRLSFKSSDNFDGCNDVAKKELTRIREFVAKQDADMCADFKAVVEGRKPVHEKNGVKGNIEAAKKFVEKHCK